MSHAEGQWRGGGRGREAMCPNKAALVLPGAHTLSEWNFFLGGGRDKGKLQSCDVKVGDGGVAQLVEH